MLHFVLYMTSSILLFKTSYCYPVETDVENDEEVMRPDSDDRGPGGWLEVLQNGFGSLLNLSQMKDTKLVTGGFTFVVMPTPDLNQITNLIPGFTPPLLPSS